MQTQWGNALLDFHLGYNVGLQRSWKQDNQDKTYFLAFIFATKLSFCLVF